ncbi:MAG: cytochrome c, partial [Planctomycetes bacterium]|nr:cytochrome c [Planctomycetota bacterium]
PARRPHVLAGLLAGLLAAAAPAQEVSEEAYRYFELNCTSCHTIGGGALTGPDLKDVLARKDSDWIKHFIQDPKRVIDSGDAYAQELLRASKGLVMPTMPSMTPEMAEKLIAVMKAESSLEKSRFAGLQISDRPLTAADVERGRALFTGEAPLLNGGPACLGCHTLEGAPGLGGGSLGPDLTQVYARLEGRKALGAWLSSPPSAVMAPVFQQARLEGDEILPLVAFLKDAGEGGAAAAPDRSLAFVLGGAALGALVLVLLDALWRGRYRATRRPLVERVRAGARPVAAGKASTAQGGAA